MRNVKALETLFFVLGLISILYGWLQSWEMITDGADVVGQTVRKYVFMVAGVILWLISFATRIMYKEMKWIEEKIFEQSRR